MAKTNLTIVAPSKAASLATALRGHINAVLAYMRLDEEDLCEDAIKNMRRDMTSLEREVRLSFSEE
jgi:hypothetical protein